MTILTTRETQLDWESPAGGVTTVNLSTELRPDALVPDYKTAFTYGPTNIGNTAGGILQNIWRADVVTGSTLTSVQLKVANGSSYSTASILFSYTTNHIGTLRELDLCFGIDARPIVSAEITNGISSSVYLYWFNGLSSNFEFTQFASSGTTPRLLLDNVSSGSSDVLLFYVSGSDDVIRYRQQRDQYATIYNIPLLSSASATENTYLEDVVKLDDSRVGIYYSRRDTSTSRWQLYRIESVLYPYYVQEEALQSSATFISGVLAPALIQYMSTGTLISETFLFDSSSLQWLTQSWEQKLFKYNHTGSFNTEGISFDSSSLQWLTQSWEQTLITQSVTTDTLISMSVSFITASLPEIVIAYTYPTDTLLSASVTFISASLV